MSIFLQSGRINLLGKSRLIACGSASSVLRCMLLVLCVFVCSTHASAEPVQKDGVWYAVYDDAEHSVGSDGYSCGFDGVPVGKVTFEAKGASGIISEAKVSVNEWVSGILTEGKFTTPKLAESWNNKEYTSDLVRNASGIQFVKTGGSLLSNPTIRKIKVTMASYAEVNATELDFGDAQVGVDKQLAFTIKHSNVAQLTVGTPSDAAFLVDTTTVLSSGPGKYGEVVVRVTFSSKVVNTYTGNVTISNGSGVNLRITLKANAVKGAQQLVWEENTDAIRLGESLLNPATATSRLNPTYTSSDERIIRIDGNKLVAVDSGAVTITAAQVGDEMWSAAPSISKEVEVVSTKLKAQHIIWDQTFYELKMGQDPVTLTATASSGRFVKYTSGNNAVVKVNMGAVKDPKTLEIVGEGVTTLTAIQEGGPNWMYTSKTVTVVVRSLDETGCADLVIDEKNKEYDIFGKTQTYDLSGRGDKLSYTMESEITGILGFGGVDPVVVTEYYADGSAKQLSSSSEPSVSNIQVSKDATRLIFTSGGWWATCKLTSVKLTSGIYLATDQASIDFGNVQGATVHSTTVKVRYSNLPDFVNVTCTNDQFELSGNMSFGTGCGSSGEEAIGVTIRPMTEGVIEGELVVEADTYKVRVPLRVFVSGNVTLKNGAWNAADTWKLGVPLAEEIVAVNHAVSVNRDAVVGAVSLATTGKLTVAPSVKLHVQGEVLNNTASRVILESSDNGSVASGSLLFLGTAPHATVEMYSRAREISAGNYYSQYIGVPVLGVNAEAQFAGAWMTMWNESAASDGTLGANWWIVKNEDNLAPFVGYALMQEAAKMYTFTGQLNATADRELPLTYASTDDGLGYRGFNFVANSWTAPIDISQFIPSDFVNAEPTIYIYDAIMEDYHEVPINGEHAQKVISPMQGFFVKATAAGAKLKLNYERVVRDAHDANQPMRSMGVDASSSEEITVRVVGDGKEDMLRILTDVDCSEDFDHGYDATKMMGSTGCPQLFSYGEQRKLAVDVSDTLRERVLGFRAGRVAKYRLHFDKVQTDKSLYLHDLKTGDVIAVVEDGTYDFEGTATDGEMPRFVLSARADAVSLGDGNVQVVVNGNELHIQNYMAERLQVILYDVMGRMCQAEEMNGMGMHCMKLSGMRSGVCMVQFIDMDSKTILIKKILLAAD